MIIFLYGPDAFRLMSRRDELLERYRAKYASGVNLLHIDMADRGSVAILENALKSNSFFDEVKLLVLKNIFSNRSETEEVAKLLKAQHGMDRRDIVIMVCEHTPLPECRKIAPVLTGLLVKGTTVESFDMLTESALQRWLTSQAQLLGCTIEHAAQHELPRRVGQATWPLALALEKLANYSHDNITLHDVHTLVSVPVEMNIFDLTDAIGNQQPSAIVQLYQQLTAGQDPYYILTMLTYHVRNLLAVKDMLNQGATHADAARKLGIHPFVARKSAEQSRKFSTTDLQKLFSHLVATEQATKSGTVYLIDELYRFALGSLPQQQSVV